MICRSTAGLVCALALSAYAEVITYECTTFPEDGGFERADVLFPADRWVEDGAFVQQADIADPGPPAESEEDFYRYYLVDLAGLESFYVDWVVETDGPREGIPNVSPAALVAGGQSGIRYHFTIATDQVRYIDSDLNVFLIDIEPGVPHTYRIEMHPDEDLWFIDGKLVLTATPPGPYPTSDSVVAFGVRGVFGEETTRWEHIRFGKIPEPGRGDYESDADLDLRDFYFFHECLESNGPDTDAWPGCLFADMDQDGDVDLSDFATFQNAFTGGE